MPTGSKMVHSRDVHNQRIQALIHELPSKIQHGFSITESFQNSLMQSIRNQIKMDGINPILITAAMGNVEQLDELSRYVQHTKNAENKIRNVSRINNTSVSQNRGLTKANVYLGAAHHQEMEQYEDANLENYIKKNPYQVQYAPF
jgi:hypothetical protein